MQATLLIYFVLKSRLNIYLQYLGDDQHKAIGFIYRAVKTLRPAAKTNHLDESETTSCKLTMSENFRKIFPSTTTKA